MNEIEIPMFDKGDIVKTNLEMFSKLTMQWIRASFQEHQGMI